jgi:hypothetical protein
MHALDHKTLLNHDLEKTDFTPGLDKTGQEKTMNVIGVF